MRIRLTTTRGFTILFLITLSSCISFTNTSQILSHSDQEGLLPSDCFDEKSSFFIYKQESQSFSEKLPSQGFNLLNWNSHKGSNKGWMRDLEHLSKKSDILVLQEGHLTKQLKDQLDSQGFKWSIANAFFYKGVPTGTLTASKIAPMSQCSFKTNEPVISIPKSVLLTRYALSNTKQTLLLVNLHLVNFSFESFTYKQQLQTIAKAVSMHEGPFIITGDFNSWNEKRKNILDEFLAQLGMKNVPFLDDKRKTFMGSYVDYIYYSGLQLIDSRTENVFTSDHNPMFATFRFSEGN